MSRGHKIVANFLKARGAWDNKPTTVSSYVGKDTAKPADKKPRLDAKILNQYVGKRVSEAQVSVKQHAYNPKPAETIISPDSNPNGDAVTDLSSRAQSASPGTNINPGKKSLNKMREALDKNTEAQRQAQRKTAEAPFIPDTKPKAGVIVGKRGRGMAMAAHLARLGLKSVQSVKPQNEQIQQVDEVHPTVMAMAQVGANKALKAKADKHTEMAVAANRAGDDEKVRYHQAQVARIKAQMKTEAKDPADWTQGEMEKMNADWRKSKGLKPVQPTRPPQKGMGAGKLPMSQAASVLAAEENLDELKASTLQSYSDKAHQQALDATYDAAHLNRPGEEKFKADAKRLAAKRAGGVQLAQRKLDKMGEALELPHSAGDVVRCTKTQRLASVQSVENDQYTVVYADGSTQTGPADYWTQIDPVNEARIVEQPRGWNVKHLKPAGHGIVGKKVRSYDFPGMHDSHYIEGHVTDEDPQSYHIRTTKVVRHHKEEPISSHMMHIRAPKGMSLFGGAPGVYYAPREMKPAVKPTMKSIRKKR